MTLTAKQTEALEALVEAFDVPEATIQNVSPYNVDRYAVYAANYAAYAGSQFRLHKISTTIDWEEVKRKQEEERLAKLAERADSVRDGIILSAFSGLIHKAAKNFPTAVVAFDADNEGASLLLWEHDEELEGRVFSLEYFKDSLTVVTILGEDRYEDNVKVLSGNQSPKEQIKGLALIHEFLNEAEKQNNDDDN